MGLCQSLGELVLDHIELDEVAIRLSMQTKRLLVVETKRYQVRSWLDEKLLWVDRGEVRCFPQTSDQRGNCVVRVGVDLSKRPVLPDPSPIDPCRNYPFPTESGKETTNQYDRFRDKAPYVRTA